MDTTAALAELDEEGLAVLVDAFRQRGPTVIGPTVRDGAIVLAEPASADELPYGWGVGTEAGTYRLRRRDDRAAFAHSAGPQSWKTFPHPPRARLWQADRAEDGTVTVREDDDPPPRYAFLGMRPCDLRAIAVQDRVLTGGAYADPVYGPRRAAAFIVVAECTEPGGVCFCVSMGTGPGLQDGSAYDLAQVGKVSEALCRAERGDWIGTRGPYGTAWQTPPAGCGALCPAYGRGCYGCYGPMETPNTRAMLPLLRRDGVADPDISGLYRTFNAEAPAFAQAARQPTEDGG
ncbi:hypothetical protein ACWCXH_00750 [Kitasatospora sp. NPDC001660]